MKNLKKIIISLITFSMLMCSMVSAATANDIITATKEAGFGEYAADISNYLQTHKMTESEATSIVDEIKKSQNVLKGRAFSELTLSEKSTLKGYAETAAAFAGLTLKVNAGNVSVVDAKGNVLREITVSQLAVVINALNFDKLQELVKVIVDYHKNPDKAFNPSSGTMQNTATSYGNYMVLGAGLILSAGAIFAISKKKALA